MPMMGTSQQAGTMQVGGITANKGCTVSVIIPNYNHTRYVAAAIQSVLNQTYRDFEIIVVDDGSTDDCGEVVSGFGSQVRYIWQENRGLAGARNTGICAAQGEFIGLLDADDQWLPSYLETMLGLADRHPEAAVYYCQARCVDVTGNELPQVLGGPVRDPATMYWTLLRANFLIPSTVLMRRSIIVDAGLFDQNLRSCEDWDLWLRILPQHTFIGTPETLIRYRIHDSSLSTNPEGMQRATRAVIEKQFGSDDGQYDTWPVEKRRAYGGVYRYYVLSSVQRQRAWNVASSHLRRALKADPNLAQDLGLFYDLALGAQPTGYRGSPHKIAIEANAAQIENMLAVTFAEPLAPQLQTVRRKTCGTAYYALGLAAYNTGSRTLGRRFLLNALRYRPDLWRERTLTGDLVKSFLSRRLLEEMKNVRRKWLPG